MFDENGNEVETVAPGSFYKNKKTDKIWWQKPLFHMYSDGRYFSFDRKTVYNTYQDYHKLSKEEKDIFDLENPFWAVQLNGGPKHVSKEVLEAYKKQFGGYPD